MISKRSRLALVGVLTLALGVFMGPGIAQAKKVKTFEEQLTVGAGIPQDVAAGPSVPLVSTIEVGKKYKKQKVGDVNVTAFQTAGSAAAASGELDAKLVSPNGRTVWLFQNVNGVTPGFGPWTMDDDTPVAICAAANCDGNEAGDLPPPYAGTTNLLNNLFSAWPTGPLSNFDGTRMKGTWTLKVYDVGGAATSTLTQWGLEIKPLRLKEPPVDID